MTVTKGRVAAVRPMTDADIASAVAIHGASLTSGYFVRLGPKFLAAYYETFVASPYGVALVATVDGNVVGALVGTTHNRHQYRWVNENRKRHLARVGAMQLLRRPLLLAQFVRTRAVRYLRWTLKMSKEKSNLDVDESSAGCLTHVAVDGNARGQGIGSVLLKEFVEEAKSAKLTDRLVLVTRSDEHGARTFYLRQGWEMTGTKSDADSFQYIHMQLPLERP